MVSDTRETSRDLDLLPEDIEVISRTVLSHIEDRVAPLQTAFANLHVDDLTHSKETLSTFIGAMSWGILMAHESSSSSFNDTLLKLYSIVDLAKARSTGDDITRMPSRQAVSTIVAEQGEEMLQRVAADLWMGQKDKDVYQAVQALFDLDRSFHPISQIRQRLDQTIAQYLPEGVKDLARPVSELTKLTFKEVAVIADVLEVFVNNHYDNLRNALLKPDAAKADDTLHILQDIIGAQQWPLFGDLPHDRFEHTNEQVESLVRLFPAKGSVFKGGRHVALEPSISSDGLSAIVAQHAFEVASIIQPGKVLSHAARQAVTAVRGLHKRHSTNMRLTAIHAALEALVPQDAPVAAPKRKAVSTPAP